MTEHVVLRRANEALADLRHRKDLAWQALWAIEDQIEEVETFLGMYGRFAGVETAAANFEDATNPTGPSKFAPSEAQRPCGDDETAENRLLNKFCPFDPSWPDDLKVRWFDDFDKLRAIHAPVSNNAPAEDARLEDGLSPSKEGGTTSAATDDSAGTSVSSADPDGGGSNSPETANEKVGGSPAVAAPFNAEEAGRTPAYAIRGRSGTSPDADVTAGETAINSAAAAETGKPAGESDGSPAAPVTKKERVAQTHDEHPDWTIAKIAAHLNLTTDAVSRHLQALGIKLGHKGSPRKKAPGEPTVREKVLAAHAAHPDWPQKQIADALGIGTGSVSNAVKGLGIEFPKSPNSLPKPDSQRARVEAFLLDHPDATVRDTATALGLAFSRVRAIAAEAGIQFRKLTPAELQAARRAGALKSAAVRRRGAGVPIAGKPEPASEPQHQPFTAGDQDEEPIAPAPRRLVLSEPKGRFYLRTAAGKYLHMSGSGLVDGRSYAWCGNQKQFEALRDKFETARDPAFVKYVPDLPAVRS